MTGAGAFHFSLVTFFLFCIKLYPNANNNESYLLTACFCSNLTNIIIIIILIVITLILKWFVTFMGHKKIIKVSYKCTICFSFFIITFVTTGIMAPHVESLANLRKSQLLL